MSIKPVDKVSFWRRRLNQMHAEGRPVHAAVYDTTAEVWARIQRDTRAVLPHYIKYGHKVLDGGCGFGSLYELLPPGVLYRGIDLSPDFIEIARFKYPEGHFEVGDLNNLKLFSSNYFDWVILRSVDGMIVENLGSTAWEKMRAELLRVAPRILSLGYEDPMPVEVIER